MLSAAVRRTSRDVSIMKEKLIFSGVQLRTQVGTGSGLCSLHPAGAHGCVYTYFTCNMQISTWHTHMYTHLASCHSNMEAHVHLQTHTPPPAAISSRSCGSVSAPGVVGKGNMQGLGEESALKVHPAICLVQTGIPQMLISPPHPTCCLLTFPD